MSVAARLNAIERQVIGRATRLAHLAEGLHQRRTRFPCPFSLAESHNHFGRQSDRRSRGTPVESWSLWICKYPDIPPSKNATLRTFFFEFGLALRAIDPSKAASANVSARKSIVVPCFPCDSSIFIISKRRMPSGLAQCRDHEQPFEASQSLHFAGLPFGRIGCCEVDRS